MFKVKRTLNRLFLSAMLIAVLLVNTACDTSGFTQATGTAGDSRQAATTPLGTDESAGTELAETVNTAAGTVVVKDSEFKGTAATNGTETGAGQSFDTGKGVNDMSLQTKGMLRLPTHDVPATISCVTSLAALKAQSAELAQKYDDKFFADQALILATYPARSGSTQVEFSSWEISGDTVQVTLQGTVNGMGTMDMAAFLVWAEVPAAYAKYNWTLAGSANNNLYYK